MSTEAMKLAIAKEALEKLAKLGNGDRHGNSIGNSIAMEALDKMAENARELGLSYEQSAQQCEHRTLISDGDPVNDMCEKCREYVNRKPAQQEPDPDELTIAYMSGVYEGKKIGAKEGRNKLATWMMQCGFATGHGDTLEELLYELDTEIEDRLAAIREKGGEE